MRFFAVSVKLLQLVVIELRATNENLGGTVALAVLAVLCQLVFVVLPMAVLLLYHLKIFRQGLTCCKLDRPGLHAVVDAYQGCFKSSATNGSERRYFAGIYLLFRFCFIAIVAPCLSFVLPIYNQTSSFTFAIVVGPIWGGVSLLMGGLVTILQPYKRTAHNVIDFLLLFIIASGKYRSSCSSWSSRTLCNNNKQLQYTISIFYMTRYYFMPRKFIVTLTHFSRY